MKRNILLKMMCALLIMKSAFAGLSVIDFNTAKININKKEWQYYTSKILFDKEVFILKNLKIKELRGTVNSKLDILKKGKKIVPLTIIKDLCNEQKEILKLAKNKTAKFNVNNSNKKFPMCIINDTDKLGSKTFIFFITKRKGKTGKFSFMSNTLTFSYPTKVLKKSRKSIKKLVSKLK